MRSIVIVFADETAGMWSGHEGPLCSVGNVRNADLRITPWMSQTVTLFGMAVGARSAWPAQHGCRETTEATHYHAVLE